jgi:hypothetical protein
MDHERPPDIDAEYKVVRGAWPRWALQLGLLKLALRAAGVVVVLLGLAVAVVVWMLRGR